MMRIKYYFRYNNLPVILPLAYKKIHYNCYNYDSSNIKDVFKLLRHETKISVISENECNDLFKNEVFNLFGNVKMIDLQRKPSLNFFDKKSSSKMMESNRYVSKVFSLILETEKFNKIIERMLNSFIYSGGELILKNFLEKYIKNSGSMEEFPMNQRMKLINYFEIENPQFLTPKNDSKIDISYYFNLSKLSEKESEIYLLILSSQNKGSIILDLKKSKHIRPINSGYFFIYLIK